LHPGVVRHSDGHSSLAKFKRKVWLVGLLAAGWLVTAMIITFAQVGGHLLSPSRVRESDLPATASGQMIDMKV